MLTHYTDLSQVIKPDDNYIDGFTSTNFAEFQSYLNPLGFFKAPQSLKVPAPSLEDAGEYVDIVLFNNRTGLMIECSDMLVPDSMQISRKQKAELGFIPMSRFRVHAKPTNLVIKELAGIVQALFENEQNTTIVDPNYTRAYVRCSEFYI